MSGMKPNPHPLAEKYVADVCSQVKAKELRPDIQDELLSHLEELIEARLAGHPDEDQEAAVRWAIKQMGDSSEVASGLNRVHKPRTPWAMLVALGLLLAVAIIVMYAVTEAYASNEMARFNGYNFAGQQLFHIAIGLAIMFMLSRLPYQRLIQHTNWLYGGAVLLMVVELIAGTEINGSPIFQVGRISFSIFEASLYIFMVLAAVSLSRSHPGSWRDALRYFIMFTLVPLLLYVIAPRFSLLMIYAFASTILLLMYRRDWRWWLPQSALILLIGSCLWIYSHYAQHRIPSFIARITSPDYLDQQIAEAIRHSAWLGQGGASLVEKLPYLHTESVFTFIIHSLGWLFGIFVVLCVLLLMLLMARAAQLVCHTPGKMIIQAIVIVLAFQFAINICMALGWVPIVGIPMPFISYGGSALLTNLAAIGLVYAIYRRKDMLRA
jgi:cell division protein FtsW (lipid II flippase)